MLRESLAEYARQFDWTSEHQIAILCEYIEYFSECRPDDERKRFGFFLVERGSKKDEVSEDLRLYAQLLLSQERLYCDISTAQRELHSAPTEIRGGATSFLIGTKWVSWNKIYQELQSLAKKHGSNKPLKQLL